LDSFQLGKGGLRRLKILLRSLIGFFGLHVTSVRHGLSLGATSGKVCVNLGAGNFSLFGWASVDHVNDDYADIQSKEFIECNFSSYDLFPFEDDSVDLFYCSHVIEHISPAYIDHFFAEVYRCLKPSGLIRIICPDATILWERARSGERDFFVGLDPWSSIKSSRVSSIERMLLEHVATLVVTSEDYVEITDDQLKRDFQELGMGSFLDKYVDLLPADSNSKSPSGHVNWFSAAKLMGLLAQKDYTRIYESRYLQSGSSAMRDPRYFDGTCPEISFYVEALK